LSLSMDIVLRYRGREVSQSDVAFICKLIAAHPTASRRRLSKLLCEAWNWRQANGELRDMVCRSLMLELHRGGHIELPEVRQKPPNNVVIRRRRAVVTIDQAPLCTVLSGLGPIDIRQVRRTADEALVDSLIEQHHYLSYVQPVGEHLKYLVQAQGRPIACLAWSSAPRHLAPRDRYIGWSAQARRQNIRYLAYNTRFLILPWVTVPQLASHLLGQMAKRVSADWERVYRHPIYYLETFVDPTRFRGTCYRAANWVRLGLTKGLGKDATSSTPNRSSKVVLGYPVHKRFRELLGRTDLPQTKPNQPSDRNAVVTLQSSERSQSDGSNSTPPGMPSAGAETLVTQDARLVGLAETQRGRNPRA